MTPTEPTAVVILGTYRAGAGALAACLAALGLALPADSAGADPSDGIVTINDAMLRDLGSHWDDPRLLTIRGQDFASGAKPARLSLEPAYQDAARQAIRASFGSHAAIVVHDSRISLFIEFWNTVLQDCGYTPRYLHIFRNPIETALSLRQRNNITLLRGTQLWMRHTLATLSLDLNDMLDAVVPYAALAGQDPNLATELAGTLNLACDTQAQAGFSGALRANLHHHAAEPDAVARSPLLAASVKSIFSLLQNWAATPRERRHQAIRQATQAYEEFAMLAGSYIALPPPQPTVPPPPEAIHRTLIIHYHLFKNAGTSVDAVLQKCFAPHWIDCEFASHNQAAQQFELKRLIAENPDMQVLSSHTLLLPPPSVPGLRVIPIIFVRHPLLRLKSAYDFERRQNADTAGAKLARQTDFAGYLRTRLAVPNDRTCRNFQAYRIAMAAPGPGATERDRALQALDQLPFIGLVEAFDASMRRLEQALAPAFPDFRSFAVHRNATGSAASDLDAIERSLGPDLYAEVCQANELDQALYEKACLKYGVSRA